MELNEAQLIPALARLGMFTIGGLIVALFITPIYTHFAYKKKWWRKARKESVDGKAAPVFYSLHKEKHKRNIPTMAGIIILISVALITLIFNLNRSETWLPLFTLMTIGLLGLTDDYLHVKGLADKTGGLSAKVQIFWLTALSLVGSYWFFYRLGWDSIHIPAFGSFEIGWLYIPLFIIVFFATSKSVGITDGLDGLSGGLLTFAFGAYAIISLFVGQYWLAAFCLTIVGALITYTWFNIFPARFFMGNTGSISLGATLGVVALLTNSVFVLPIIGFVFFLESGSSAIQILSKKLRNGKKIFLSAPIHHHFEATGWPETKVTMRFWIIGMVAAVLGVIIGILGRG
jgi:phospho-N-acetylmuramoyl-pentapeptide-transferase